MKFLSHFKKPWLKIASVIFVFTGLLFGRTTNSKPRPTPSVRDRITAVQKAIQHTPEAARQPHVLNAQWGNWNNWPNWANWNNWNNWANWANWNNWGNWINY